MAETVDRGVRRSGRSNVRNRLESQILLSTHIMSMISFGSIFLWKFDLAGLLGIVDFSVITLPSFLERVSAPDFIDDFIHRLKAFLAEEALAMLLFAFTVRWYYNYLAAVQYELEILSRLFSKLNPPKEYTEIQGSGSVKLLSWGLTGAFAALAFWCDSLALYCMVLLLLNMMDFRGNAMIRQNLRQFLMREDLMPRETDADRHFVLRRRAVAETYWIERPQLERIMVMVFANVIALLIHLLPAILPTLAGLVNDPWLTYGKDGLATAIIVGTILWNEGILSKWRKERDNKLDEIDLDEEAAVYNAGEARG